MIKQVVFLKRRPDITMEEFKDYYENQHSQLAKRMGAKPSLPNAQRYVRRYVTPEKNPLTGEVIHPGYDCIMEIWWNTREDFEAAMKGLGNPEFLQARLEDETEAVRDEQQPGVHRRGTRFPGGSQQSDSPVHPGIRRYERARGRTWSRQSAFTSRHLSS